MVASKRVVPKRVFDGNMTKGLLKKCSRIFNIVWQVSDQITASTPPAEQMQLIMKQIRSEYWSSFASYRKCRHQEIQYFRTIEKCLRVRMKRNPYQVEYTGTQK